MGAIDVIVGLQWGDEGKGRISNFTSEKATMVVRANGGANAGHTVVKDDQKYALHLLPSSIINPNCISVIAAGVVVDLEILKNEMVSLIERGIQITPQNLRISTKAHIVMPWYKDMDGVYESLRENPIGTTRRGIGPAYSIKALRTGMRMVDLVGATQQSLETKLSETYSTIKSLYEEEMLDSVDIKAQVSTFMEYAEFFAPYICETVALVNNEADKPDSYIVIEGAQATGLDIDYGTYPDVTSSSCIAPGLCAAAGIGRNTRKVYGIMKAYTSRVGEGPFPTELKNKTGDLIRELGHEYGTTTGRPRRCGWLDLFWLKYATQVNGVTDLCINHFDTIGKLNEIMVCVGYQSKSDKVRVQEMPEKLEEYEPIYVRFQGGWTNISSIRKYWEDTEEFWNSDEECPEEVLRAVEFLAFIQRYLNVKVACIGWGPEQSQVELLCDDM